MADLNIRRNFPDYAPPTSPEHPLLSGSGKRSSDDVIGERLFTVTEHFMSWVISLERKPEEHRNILRNLECILQVCSIALSGKFMTGLEETHAMGLLGNLTEGLENGKEHWEDIEPATELMLIQLERNPKSHVVAQLVRLRNAFHDHTDRSDELSQKLKIFTDYIIVRLSPEMSRELAQTISKHLELFLHQKGWGLIELSALEQQMIQLFTPPEGLKG
ncbi:MAG: hypothetical protein H7A40_00735 [Chlamydiales bacterium]|nr:hypothetical protein [Chlamydiales bacterium]